MRFAAISTDGGPMRMKPDQAKQLSGCAGSDRSVSLPMEIQGEHIRRSVASVSSKAQSLYQEQGFQCCGC